MKRYYMHTLDGKPATFDEDGAFGQIVYADQLPRWQDEPTPVVLRNTLDEIRADQQRSREFRERMKWDVPRYGWCVVDVPAPGETRISMRRRSTHDMRPS
jgi:hypothetical protein